MNRLSGIWDAAEAQINNKINIVLQMYGKYGLSQRQMAICLTVAAIVVSTYKLLGKVIPQRQRAVYVKDFAIFTSSDPKTELSNTDMLTLAREKYGFRAEQLNFMRRISNNGLGPRCSIPPNLLEHKYSIEDARAEAQYVMFPTIQKLFDKTGICPKDIDVIVTNCSLFCPTPSLSAMIINKFKMKHTIHNFSLGGMGCSAGPCGIDLIYHFMQQKKYKYALHVSTENITQNFYKGTNRSMLLPNVLFRIGCSAVLLTNVKDRKCKYKINNLVRTHMGAVDHAYQCIYQTHDEQGNNGVFLARTITSNAIKCLSINMRTLFMQILPINVKLQYVAALLAQKLGYLYTTKVKKMATTYPKPLMPKIDKVVNNFCFHTGGRGVIDGMQDMFKLSDEQIEASRGALFRYGNISSASIWYELAYHESAFRIKKGNLIWQIAFGSGFKTNSLVLRALKTLDEQHQELISWFDEYDKTYRFTKDMVPKGWVQEPEKSIKYEELDEIADREREESEWARIKEKWFDKFVRECGMSDVKEVQPMACE